MNEDAVLLIRQLVWSGFYNADEIQEIVTEDMFEPGEVDTEWCSSQIAQEFERKSKDEYSWPTVTDCEQLTAAFDELDAGGVIALENAGYEQSDGITDITQIYLDQGGPASSIEGYCFHHGQDLERAVDGNGLMLTFGDIDGADEKGLEIGRRIVATLERHGFQVEWPGTINRRIEIPNIKWQRRYSEPVD